ncbi:MAG: hypothetical protein KKB21_03345 [Nanoarchaeota archaeon]|nr:hypothetical protein [Nanoarchaeota archaeon]MBU4086584.1 hypothetical protein [Nanoarchaeota archaeon]
MDKTQNQKFVEGLLRVEEDMEKERLRRRCPQLSVRSGQVNNYYQINRIYGGYRL